MLDLLFGEGVAAEGENADVGVAAGYFFQEDRLSDVRFEECKLNLGKEHADRHTGEAGAAAQIHDTRFLGLEQLGRDKTFEKMLPG